MLEENGDLIPSSGQRELMQSAMWDGLTEYLDMSTSVCSPSDPGPRARAVQPEGGRIELGLAIHCALSCISKAFFHTV